MKTDIPKPIKIIFTILFASYILLLVYLTFFSPYFGRSNSYRRINLIPFKTIMQFITSDMGIKNILTNIAGNIVAFMPLGLLIPIVFKSLNGFWKVLSGVLLTTFMIEAAQFLFAAGISDIDDIILNLLGGILGYMLYKAAALLHITSN